MKNDSFSPHISNEPLLREAVENIINDPKSWDQTHWSHQSECGTTHCLAGHVVIAAGYQLVYNVYFHYAYSAQNPTTGHLYSIPTLAQKLLGISEEDAYRLFISNQTKSMPRFLQTIKEITGVEFKVTNDNEFKVTNDNEFKVTNDNEFKVTSEDVDRGFKELSCDSGFKEAE